MKKINLEPIISYLVAVPEIGNLSSLALLLGVDKNFFTRIKSGIQTGQKAEIKVRVLDALQRRAKDQNYLQIIDELYNLLPTARAELIFMRNSQLEANWREKSYIPAPTPPTVNQILMT